MSEEDVRKLDGSIKKNSAFVKKLRTMTEAQKEVLSSDFRNLNLSKYIQEAVSWGVKVMLITNGLPVAPTSSPTCRQQTLLRLNLRLVRVCF